MILVACAKTPPALLSQQAEQQKVMLLTEALLQLPGPGDREEARRIAATAVHKSAQLYRQFEVDTSPRLHNLMINLGLRERGLCYDWAGDLQTELSRLQLHTYVLHPAVAHRGSLFLEHSSIVVSTRGKPFESGLVLDAWRYSGDLFWVRVGHDTYDWQPW